MVQFYLDYVILLSRMSLNSSFKTKLSDILINVMKVCTCSLIMDHIPRHLKPKITYAKANKKKEFLQTNGGEMNHESCAWLCVDQFVLV